MLWVDCPLCGEPVEYRVIPGTPGTYYDPPEPDTIEYEPLCECAEARCVDTDKYYEWLDELVQARGLDYDPFEDARIEALRDKEG